MNPGKIALENVQETLLLPLWGRSVENRKKNPLLVDPKAEEIITMLDFDFLKFEKRVHPLSRAAWIARSRYFDEKIREHLRQFPDASIIHIGCGLDTTFDRMDNRRATWYEIDLPEVIELRKTFLAEQENRIFIGESALSDSWYGGISKRNHLFLFMGGVIYYFDEDEVKRLIGKIRDAFSPVTMAFDYSSVRGVGITNRKLLNKGGMNSEVRAKWGINDIREIETWQPGIKVIETMSMFEKHKKLYPPWKRIGMHISDRLKVMSLAEIKMA